MMKIYLTNLGKYNEGELIGEWVDLPASDQELEEVFKRIGISNEPDQFGRYYEEYFITDYECSYYRIDEYSNLEELNEIARKVQDAGADSEVLEALLNYGYNLEEAIEKLEDCITWSDCEDMTDVAIEYAEETGLLDSVPQNLRNYFDFEAYGRDMELEGYNHFIFTESGDCIQVAA